MAVNYVTCAGCGRSFDPAGERNLYDRATRSYTCSICLARSAVPAAPVKRRGKVGTVLRIAFGVLFLITAFSSLSDGDSVWLTCLIIGAALLLWQFWPPIILLIRGKKARAAAQKQAEELRQRAEEERARELNRQWVCPHCGATTSGMVCEYCGMSRDQG